MIRIIYTRRAEDELRAIWRYIADDNDNEPAADRILLAISEKSNCYETIPGLARAVPTLPKAPGC